MTSVSSTIMEYSIAFACWTCELPCACACVCVSIAHVNEPYLSKGYPVLFVLFQILTPFLCREVSVYVVKLGGFSGRELPFHYL